MRLTSMIEVEDILTKDILKTSKISTRTLRKYILAAFPLLEEVITNDIPEKITLELDGCTMDSTY